MTNKELAEWILRFPEDEMTYYCVAFNGCGAIALAHTGTSWEQAKDAFICGTSVLEDD